MKNFFWLVVVLFMIQALFLDILLDYYADKKTTNTNYSESLKAKAKHMELQKNALLFDYIFIGSSNTYLHINSEIFNKKKINVYNYGVSGRTIIEYPYAVEKAIKLKPKNIVLVIRVNELYKDELGQSLELNLFEHNWDYIKSVTNVNELYAYIKQTIKNMHSILVYKDAIYYRLRSLFYKFNPVLSSNKGVDFPNAMKDAIETENVYGKESPQNIKSKNVYSMSSNKPACNIVDTMYMQEGEYQVKCSNGDGIMYGSLIARKDYKIINNSQQKLGEPSVKYLKYLNLMIDNIVSNNINAILVLIADKDIDYKYNLTNLKRKLHTSNVVEMNKFKIKDEFWYDLNHLNHVGRDIYSEELLFRLENIHN